MYVCIDKFKTMGRKIIFDDDNVINFMESNGTVANIDGYKYMYIPYWFKVIDDNTMEFINWDRLPKELKDYLENRRV